VQSYNTSRTNTGLHLTKIIRRFLLIFAISFCTLPTAAQVQNEYGIDPECFEIYYNANKKPASPQALKASEQMHALAVKKGDKKAQCLSLMLPLYHYRAVGDLTKMHESAEKARKEARSLGLKDIYYEAYDLEARINSDNGNYATGIEIAKKMLEEAKNDGYEYGMFLAYRQSAVCLKRRRLNSEAYEAYVNALEHISNTRSRAVVETYVQMFNVAPASQRPAYVRKAWAATRTFSDSLYLYSNEAVHWGEKNDSAQFYANYIPLVNHRHFPYSLSEAQQTLLKAFNASFSGRYEEAKTYTRKLTNPQQRYSYERLISIYHKDWKNAYQMQSLITSQRDSLYANNLREDLASFNAQIGNFQLQQEMDKNRLELEHQNQIREEEHKRYLIEVEHAETERQKAEAEAKRLEAEKARSAAEQAQRDEEFRSKRMKLVAQIIAAFSAITVLIIIVLTVALTLRKRSLNRERLLTKQLEKARQEAENASKMKDLFVQNMSHEIRTPLNAVMGFSQILTTPGIPLTDEEKTEFGRHISNSGQMLTMLIDDILNISDIESGRFSINKQDERINDICRSSMAFVEYRVQPGVELKFTTELDDTYIYNTDARRVQQVLVNYLTNACKHTEKGSITLHASLSEKPGWLIFSVTDTGEGVPADQAEKIFQRFTKLNNFVQGTGVGLNVCLSIAERLDGIVRLDTTYTSGARFLFELPLTPKRKEA